MKNSFVSKGGGNSFVSKYMPPAASGAPAPDPEIWDEIVHATWIDTAATIRTDTATTQSIYLDMSEVDQGRIVRITMTTTGNQSRAGFSTNIVENLPEYGEATQPVIDDFTVPTGDVRYIEVDEPTAESLVYYYSSSASGEVDAVDLMPAVPEGWDGESYEVWVSLAGNAVDYSSGEQSIYIACGGEDVGTQYKVTLATNGNKADWGECEEDIYHMPLGILSGPTVSTIADGTLTSDPTYPHEYILTKTQATTKTIAFWIYLNGSVVVESVEKL